MVTASIRSSLSSVGYTIYKALTDPIVRLVKALLAYPTVTNYTNITNTLDAKLSVTFSELDKVIHGRVWLSCFYDREATLDKAADNCKQALIALKTNLCTTAQDADITAELVKVRTEYIMAAVSYVLSQQLSDAQKNRLITGLTSLQSYVQYLDTTQKYAYKNATGISISDISSKPREKTIKDQADQQVQRLETIDRDLQRGVSDQDAATLRQSAREIKKDLQGNIIPELVKELSDQEKEEFKNHLNDLDMRIFPPTRWERLTSWISQEAQ